MSESVWERIERSRERWDVLRHPFYRRWSAGTLSREELGRYSGQYRHAVVAIAELSEDVARELPERGALGGERKPRRVHAERDQARVAVAPVPFDPVRQRADAVELGEVEEVHQHRPGGGELGHLRRAVGVQPAQPAGQLGGGDVRSLGAQRRRS